ncbi:MAG: hypothetical protein IPK57_10945 [Chitinophagaceae bacterium]|nr:hypothetical protein [Chitinophagaceae bacterium]
MTKEYGKLVISATEQQLLEGEKRLFKIYGVRAKGKQNLSDGKPFDLKLIDYITYNPNYDEHKLDLLIERASVNWNVISNVDSWLEKIRGVQMDSILLDTSFCIRLLKNNDDLHQNAKDYFKYFLEKKIEIYLSSIVIAEYSVKDAPANLPLEFVKIIPFDFFDGKTAEEFHSILLNHKEQVASIERNVIKDDCKLMAQLFNRNIQGYITKDRKSFSQIIAPILASKIFVIEVLDLEIPLKDFKGELF